MRKYLLILSALLIISATASAQQTVTTEPSVYYYTISITDIGNWSDDGTIKTIQTVLKPIFEVNPVMNENGEFKDSTDFFVYEAKTAYLIQEAGFSMSSFNRKTNLQVDFVAK